MHNLSHLYNSVAAFIFHKLQFFVIKVLHLAMSVLYSVQKSVSDLSHIRTWGKLYEIIYWDVKLRKNPLQTMSEWSLTFTAFTLSPSSRVRPERRV